MKLKAKPDAEANRLRCFISYIVLYNTVVFMVCISAFWGNNSVAGAINNCYRYLAQTSGGYPGDTHA